MEMDLEKIMSIRQEGTVNEYCEEFQFLFDQVKNSEEMSEDYATYLFIFGLKPEIGDLLMGYHNIGQGIKLEDAFFMARLRERALNLDSNQEESTNSEVTTCTLQNKSDSVSSCGGEEGFKSPYSSQFTKMEFTHQVFEETPKRVGNIAEHKDVHEPSNQECGFVNENSSQMVETFEDKMSLDICYNIATIPLEDSLVLSENKNEVILGNLHNKETNSNKENDIFVEDISDDSKEKDRVGIFRCQTKLNDLNMQVVRWHTYWVDKLMFKYKKKEPQNSYMLLLPGMPNGATWGHDSLWKFGEETEPWANNIVYSIEISQQPEMDSLFDGFLNSLFFYGKPREVDLVSMDYFKIVQIEAISKRKSFMLPHIERDTGWVDTGWRWIALVQNCSINIHREDAHLVPLVVRKPNYLCPGHVAGCPYSLESEIGSLLLTPLGTCCIYSRNLEENDIILSNESMQLNGSMRELSSAIDLQVFSLINLVKLIKGSVQNRDVTVWVWDPGSIIQIMGTSFICGLLRTKVFEEKRLIRGGGGEVWSIYHRMFIGYGSWDPLRVGYIAYIVVPAFYTALPLADIVVVFTVGIKYRPLSLIPMISGSLITILTFEVKSLIRGKYCYESK